MRTLAALLLLATGCAHLAPINGNGRDSFGQECSTIMMSCIDDLIPGHRLTCTCPRPAEVRNDADSGVLQVGDRVAYLPPLQLEVFRQSVAPSSGVSISGTTGTFSGAVSATTFTATAATATFISNATDGNFGFCFGSACASGFSRSASNHKTQLYANNTQMMEWDSDNGRVSTGATLNSTVASGSTAMQLTTGALACLGSSSTDCVGSAGQAQSAKVLVGATSAGYSSLYFAGNLSPFPSGSGAASSQYTIRSDPNGQTEINSGAGSLGLNIANTAKINITASLITASTAVRVTDTKTVGTITIGGGGTGTATVASGATCVCSETSTALPVGGLKCSVSSTTLTATSTAADVIAYVCF